MRDILTELWRGRLFPAENIAKDEAYRQLHKRICKAEEDLLSGLNGMQKEELEVYRELCLELSSLENETVFSKGFRLGAKFMMAVLWKES